MPHEFGVDEVYHVGTEETNESVATTEGTAGIAKGDVMAALASIETKTLSTAAYMLT